MSLILALPLLAVDASSDDDEESRGRVSPDLVEYVEVKGSSLPSSNTIATKLAVPLQMTPANVGVVGGALIYEQSAFVLGDTLRNVSGLNVHNGSGVSEFFSIRGFDSISSALVMTDGAAEPEVSYYQMYNVRGVEVFKGPAGFLYGKNPLAGAVNIVRKQPLPSNFTVFSGSYGSFDSGQGTVDWNLSPGDDTVSFRLNGMWQESDHYRDDKESQHIAVNPSLTWRIGEKSTLNFNLEYVDAEYSPDAGLPLVGNAIADVTRRRSYQDSGDFSDQTLNRFQIDFESKLSDAVTLRNKAYYRDLDWKTDGTLLQGSLPFNPDLNPLNGGTPWLLPGQVQVIRDLGRLDDTQQYVGNQLELLVSMNSGPIEHELLVGLEVTRESDEYSFGLVALRDVELASLQPTDPLFDFGGGGLSPATGDVTNTIVAPYAIDQMKLSSNVELVLGLRYDNIDQDGDITPLGLPLVTTYSRDDSKVSPMAGLVFAPTPTLSLYANAARSYAPPSSRVLNEIDPLGREPERGSQIELGAKKQFLGDRIRTTFALYQLDRDRIPLTDPFTGFTQQSADQRSRGAEIELAAEPWPGLRTFFSYAYNDAELTEFMRVNTTTGSTEDLKGNTPIMAPKHLANLWISKSFGNGFGISGGVRFVDEQFVDEGNGFAIDSAVVLDAAAFYDMKAWRFKLNLKNLTDEEYELRGIAGASSVLPADPFAIYGSVEFRM